MKINIQKLEVGVDAISGHDRKKETPINEKRNYPYCSKEPYIRSQRLTKLTFTLIAGEHAPASLGGIPRTSPPTAPLPRLSHEPPSPAFVQYTQAADSRAKVSPMDSARTARLMVFERQIARPLALIFF